MTSDMPASKEALIIRVFPSHGCLNIQTSFNCFDVLSNTLGQEFRRPTPVVVLDKEKIRAPYRPQGRSPHLKSLITAIQDCLGRHYLNSVQAPRRSLATFKRSHQILCLTSPIVVDGRHSTEKKCL